MDAHDQRPELTTSTAAEAGPVAAEREAACRAAHPSARRLPTSDPRVGNAAAAHFEQSAVRWLGTQSDRLDAWPAADDERAAALLALGDLALLIGVRLRRGTEPLSPDYAALLTSMSAVAASADTRELLRREPRALLPLVTVQWALTAAGKPDPCLAQTLELVLAERSVPGLARTAADQIALHLLLRQSGIDLPCPQLADLVATSVLADDTVALELTPSQVRALTSIVVTASDFGSADIAWPAGRTSAGVAGVLEEWLPLAMANDDPGLAGALLAGLTCLGASTNDLIESARRWLHGWQESDGRSDGVPSEAIAESPEFVTWAAAIHATTATALDGLLLQTVVRSVAGHRMDPAASEEAAANTPRHVGSVMAPSLSAVQSPLAPPTAELVESIMAAADWLDAVLPGTHVSGRLQLSEAWIALGDEDEARRQLIRLADDPHLAFTVLKQAPEQAVHLAALVVALNLTTPPLADLCDDVAALLTHPDAARELFGRTPTPGAGPDAPVASPADDELRRLSAALCAALVRDGRRTSPGSRDALDDLMLLSRATQRATVLGDIGWLASTLRGLLRLQLVPGRMVQDATTVIRGIQRADGAMGPRPAGDCRGSDDRQVRWTLAALTALVAALPPA